GVTGDHRDLDHQEAAPVDAAIGGVEADFAGVVRDEELEAVVRRDLEGLDLRFVDRPGGLVGALGVQLPVQVDLNERHLRFLSVGGYLMAPAAMPRSKYFCSAR